MIASQFRVRTLLYSVASLMAVGIVVTACSSSGSTASAPSTAAATTSSAPGAATSAPPAASLTISTHTGSSGTYLTDASGRALYLFVSDTAQTSSCTPACAKFWPPLVSATAPAATDGVLASKLASITRPDGSRQITYGGHPLYYFANDTKAGDVTGQGSNGFGAKWWLVTVSGDAITTP
ncbi:MAG: hypothetical protein JWM76_2370 [Pseudonocardiales bacterium]|nr:hypothetical protein [Pseudonocardiales bacterium]